MTTVQVAEHVQQNGQGLQLAQEPTTRRRTAPSKFEELRQRAAQASQAAVETSQELINAAKERETTLLGELEEVRGLLVTYAGKGGVQPSLASVLLSAPETPRRRGRPAKVKVLTAEGTIATAKAQAKSKTARLARRSPESISADALNITKLVKKNGKTGMRAEQIRSELGIEKRAWNKLIHAALATGNLRVEGQKRATTYFSK
jgi:hypothetical protein